MEEQQLPSVSGRKYGKHYVIAAAASLLVVAAIATAIALWPEKQNVTQPGYTTVEEALSQEELEARALEAVREYMPTAASLTLERQWEPGGTGGSFGVKDASGADLGFIAVDGQGTISSVGLFGGDNTPSDNNLSLEEAEDVAVGIIAGKGIDPELLLLEEAKIHNLSEHVTEYQLMYRPHIGNVPVYNLDNCYITLSPADGSIMFFSLHGSFVLPDTTPTETLVTEEEATTLALDEFRKSMEGSNPAQDYQGSLVGTDFVVTEPVKFVYAQMDDSITPFWKITVGHKGTMGGREYQVNATTGEVMLSLIW